jgi:predicted PurR-regulated permease PerM
MAVFDTAHQRAAWLVAILGIIVLVALAPFASGLLAAPVLYVVFKPVHNRVLGLVKSRRIASGVVIVLAMVTIVLPLAWMVSLLVGQAQDAATSIIKSPILQRLNDVHIGTYAIGPQLKEASTKAVSLLGGGAVSLVSTAARVTLNLLLTFFGLYYILMSPDGAWQAVRPFIPFSDATVDHLHQRFGDVTKSTVIGTGLSAFIQGILVGVAFVVAGLGDPVFWGAVTVVLAILPVVGGGMVFGPAALVLLMTDRVPAGIAMLVWGVVVVGNVDNFIRPYISNRYAQVHPLITLVGALAGVSYLGIVGLLIGPLALSYFFELVSVYQKEYLRTNS